MSTDAELLQRYTRDRSEAAFAELVQRHLPLVYSAAVRQTGGDAHLAQDVAQTVFTALARKAATLTERATLVGWLYLGTHHAAAQAVRTNRRREAREQEAHAMHELLAPATSAADWDRVRPVLDEAMRELSEPDREAVLLRYFELRPFADIGAALNLSEDAARMRVERALDKLHALLARRGITSTTAALAVALQGHVIAATPAGLAATVTGFALGAVGAGVAAGGFLTTLFPSVAAVSAAIVAVGAALYNVRENQAADLALAAVRQQTAVVAARLRDLEQRAAAEARETDALELAVATQRQAASAAAAKPAGPSPDDPGVKEMQAGKEFLASSPEARRLIEDLLWGLFDRDYVVGMRAAGLSEAEADRIAREAAKLDSLTIDPGVPGIKFQIGPEALTSRGDPVVRRMRDLLGEARFRTVQEARLAAMAKGVVRTVAGATFDTDVPLTTEQAAALGGIIERNRRVESQDAAATVYTVDWTAIRQQAAGVLAAPQLAVLHAAVEDGAPPTQTLRTPPP